MGDLVDEDRRSGVRQDDETAPSSAAESMRLIQDQRAVARRSLRPDPRFIYLPWGFAWLIGFGLLFLRHGPDEQVRWSMPSWLPLTTLFALMGVAFVISGIAGSRAGRHISGESSTRGLMYGVAWFAGFATIGVTASHVSRFLPPPERGLLWSALSVGTVGLLYLAGSAIWKSWDLFVLGLWLTVSNIVGVAVGEGWHSLVSSLAGGGGLIVAGLIEWLRMRRKP